MSKTFRDFSSFRNFWDKFKSLFTLRVILLLFVFCIYGLTIHFTLQGPNPTSRFLLTKSIAERGVFWSPEEYLDFDKYGYWLTPDYALIDGKIYCDKAPGLSFLAVPFFILGKAIGPILEPFLGKIVEPYVGYSPDHYLHPDNDIYAVIGIQLGLSLFAALGILRVFDISRLMGVSERNSMLASLITAFATPYWVYARSLFGHVLAGVFLISSIYHIMKFREEKKYFHLILAGFFSGYGFVIEFPQVFAIPWIVVLLLLPLTGTDYTWKERLKHLSVFGIVTSVSALPLFYYNLTAFGELTANALSFSHWAGILHLLEPVHDGIVVLILSETRGLLYFSPIIIFGLVGLFIAYRRYPLETAVIASLIFTFIIFYSKKWESHGGAAFGPRYLVPILLLFGLGFGWAIEKVRGLTLAQGTMLVTGAFSFMISFLGALFAMLIFEYYPNGNNGGLGGPIFDEALTKLQNGDTNAPFLKQLSYEFEPLIKPLIWFINPGEKSFEDILGYTLLLMVIISFILVIMLLISTNTEVGVRNEVTAYQRIEAYIAFAIGNFIFLISYFTQICFILSSAYISNWEESRGEIFTLRGFLEEQQLSYLLWNDFNLYVSEVWLILIFSLLVIHSFWTFYSLYSSQIKNFLSTSLEKVKNRTSESD
ncbi:MAG: glycosyltransferase family 39 protein [Candidatus Heimdallarchaeota archaeon]|nr:MAG: glycosyltransferase family 39 protein [Candidatus Heimdallarchaeota archaeon]